MTPLSDAYRPTRRARRFDATPVLFLADAATLPPRTVRSTMSHSASISATPFRLLVNAHQTLSEQPAAHRVVQANPETRFPRQTETVAWTPSDPARPDHRQLLALEHQF